MNIPVTPVSAYNYGQIIIHIRGWAALEVTSEQYGSLLISMIVCKLPSDIKLCAISELTDEHWKIDELVEVILKEVEAREFNEGMKIKLQPFNPKPPTPGRNPPTSSAFMTPGHNIYCAYCGGQHYSASCGKVKFAKGWKYILIKKLQLLKTQP